MKLRAASIAEYSALPVLATTVIALVHSGWMPNDIREQRGPAATDVRTATDLNGWSPSAPRNC